MVGIPTASMIVSESSNTIRSPSLTGPAGERTAVWHPASESNSSGMKLRLTTVTSDFIALRARLFMIHSRRSRRLVSTRNGRSLE